MSTAGDLWKCASHYEVLGLIGQGGMGSVYKARDRRLERLVALKFLSAGLLDSSDARELFRREAQAIATLNHPNIGVLYDVGEAEGAPFLVLEYLGGGSLERRGSNRQLPVAEILDYALQLASGLSHAHGHGIIHRDVKPSNALFAETGVLKLVDFGLAQWRGSAGADARQSPGGTPHYMAPEVHAGREIDQRCDVFAFGVLLYQLAAGRLPFQGVELPDLVWRIKRELPPALDDIRPDLPKAFVELVGECLRKDASQRPGSMALIRHELEMMEPARAEHPARGREAWDSPTLPASPSTTPIPPAPSPPSPAAKGLARLWRLALPIALVSLLIVVLAIYQQMRPGSTGPQAERLVVVLPFDCRMTDQSAVGFCRGLHADLLPRLNQTRRFQSAFWTVSAAELATMGVRTAQEAGARLNARLAIQGVVNFSEGEYRIHLDLTDARSARLLRSQVVSSRNTLDLPGSLLAASLDLLDTRITATRADFLAAAPTTVPESYRLTVQAQGLLLEYEGLEVINRAASLLGRALELDPNNATAHALLSQAWQQEFTYGGNPEALAKATLSAETARRLKPDDIQVKFTVGRALRSKGDFAGAIRAFEEASRISPTDPEGYRLQGLAYLGNRQEPEALDAFAKAIEVNPRWWPTYHNRATYWFRKGKTEIAIQDLQTALALAPGHADILRDLGIYYTKLGRTQEAEQSLKKSIAMRPTPRAYLSLAYLKEQQNSLDEAVKLLQDAAVLGPDYYLIYFNLASVRSQIPGQESQMRESAAKAAELLSRLLTVSPKDAGAWSQLALCRARLGDFTAARQAAETALRLRPDSIAVLRNAAVVAAFESRKSEAVALLARAVSAGEDPGEILRDTDLRGFFSDAAMRRQFETRK